jgi:transcriptional regulator with XRE-family HTH domain
MEIHERIKELRTALKLSQRDFSKHIYISQGAYAEIELGKQNVNNRIIQLISTQYNVNKNWITRGEGAMFSTTSPDIKLEQLKDIFNELDELLQDYLLLQSKELLKIQKEKIDRR